MEKAVIEMPKYKSHKTVWALQIAAVIDKGTDTTTDENPIVELTFVDSRYDPIKINLRGKPTPQAGWYMVQYEDGYISFSPQEQFEKGNTRIEGSEFGGAETSPCGLGWAIKQLWYGSLIEREGWNGKGMFLLLVPGSRFKVNRAPLLGIFPEGTEIDYNPHIDIKGVDGKITPWVPSQTDVLAVDYRIVRP